MKKKIFFLIFLFLVAAVSAVCAPSIVDTWFIFLDLRVPRVFLAMLVGAILVLQGYISQILFQNPVADPFSLGISSAHVFGYILFLSIIPSLGFTGAVFGGFFLSLTVSVFLYRIQRRFYLDFRDLLLVGFTLGTLFSSATTVILVKSDPQYSASFVSWLFGFLDQTNARAFLFCLISLVSLIVVILFYRCEIELVSINQEQAFVVGVDVDRLFQKLFIVLSISLSLVVSTCGIIGFIGLVIPNLLRQRHFYRVTEILFYGSILGSLSLVLGDAVARTLFYPQEIPVGAVLALLGAPLYLSILKRGNTHVSS